MRKKSPSKAHPRVKVKDTQRQYVITVVSIVAIVVLFVFLFYGKALVGKAFFGEVVNTAGIDTIAPVSMGTPFTLTVRANIDTAETVAVGFTLNLPVGVSCDDISNTQSLLGLDGDDSIAWPASTNPNLLAAQGLSDWPAGAVSQAIFTCIDGVNGAPDSLNFQYSTLDWEDAETGTFEVASFNVAGITDTSTFDFTSFNIYNLETDADLINGDGLDAEIEVITIVPPAVCGASNLAACDTEAECTEAGLYWWSTGVCNIGMEPVITATACGDGTIAATEECDDQNTLAGNGCSSTCQIEEGFIAVNKVPAAVQTTGVMTTVEISGSPILEVTAGTNLQDVSVEVSADGSQVATAGFTTEIEGTTTRTSHFVYVSNTNRNGVYVCPRAQSLVDISTDCEGRIDYTHAQCTTLSFTSCQISSSGNSYRVAVSGSGVAAIPSAVSPGGAQEVSGTSPEVTSSGGGGGGGGGFSCTSQWSCTQTWSVCNTALQQSRTCTDTARCDQRKLTKSEVRPCFPCDESWVCREWSNCQSGQQSRSCVDERNCETAANQPVLQKSCTQVVESGTAPTQVQPQLPPPSVQQPQLAQPVVSAPIQTQISPALLVGILTGIIIIAAGIVLLVIHQRKKRLLQMEPPLGT